MVNAPPDTTMRERRERDRPQAAHSGMLGSAKLNPFGDLHTLQHLSARFARTLRGVFEPMLRQEVRSWAEPLVVQRFADYRAERGDGLIAWLPMVMTPGAAQALCVMDGRFILELLDLFFGGTGAVPPVLPAEFSPAGEAMIARIGQLIATPLKTAWEPMARFEFQPTRVEVNPAMIAELDGEDAMIVTRFGLATGAGKPVFLDLVYPVTALKPHAPSLTTKVLGKTAEPDPAWRNELTRAAMNIRFPIRSVLAEPVVSLQMLMDLKPGDVIPITISGDVPVMVGNDRLGCGTVGTSNGFAAIQLTSITRIDEGFAA
ncbi:Flagellar motor switch protein FliM [Sphingomonas sp. T1]|jgi:flagellar motor switch protein FliM|uniref:Flagellar motor switch protein FliM n=3 Tax=Sphingomonadaceae TaxID=41297 RepID=A0A2T4YW31_9SPHN|nr:MULTISPECIES: flagellar motor switch protein FliM [Sphingomonas]KHA64915.1 flagellar motor switch protein FliM [Sphingomonas sp. Ant20]KQN21516.1 flagellar motor switch protein FliM [Sphingomonas sp. Leaf30]MBD8469527.1 flagellar motor switch protein FliM [Sphingomonas sp. CFBP 8765]MBD8552286.1 flagellar motor switch protein FliM [Sphingomonas sp. CFBP 8764]MBD8640179.1 flagellar motor switch protein FliM [Sphingomonas sp. CFBP 13733]